MDTTSTTPNSRVGLWLKRALIGLTIVMIGLLNPFICIVNCDLAAGVNTDPALGVFYCDLGVTEEGSDQPLAPRAFYEAGLIFAGVVAPLLLVGAAIGFVGWRLQRRRSAPPLPPPESVR